MGGFGTMDDKDYENQRLQIANWILTQKLEDQKNGVVRSDDWYEREAKYRLFDDWECV